MSNLKEYREKIREPYWREVADNIGGKLGDELVLALKELYEIYTDDMLDWYAELYDPNTGAFFYSKSARDNEFVVHNGRSYRLLPDAESMCQAFHHTVSMGITNDWREFFPKEILDKSVRFIRGLQDENGFFYHPQWGKEMVDSHVNRRSRDLVWCGNFLNDMKVQPIYDTPNGIKGERSAKFISEAEDGKAEEPKGPFIAEHFRTKEKYLEYLSGLDMKHNSYHCGNLLVTQLSQICTRDKQLEEAGADYRLLEMTVDWLDAQLNPITGHWDDKAGYYGVNGLLKTVSFYNTAKRPLLYPEAAARSAMDAMTDTAELSGIVDIFNTFWAVNNVCYNLRNCGFADGDERADKIKAELMSRSPELVRISRDKALPFKKPDGSFSYCPKMSSPTSQDMPVAIYGSYEGDINGNGLASVGLIEKMAGSLGISVKMPPLFSDKDGERYRAMLIERERKG
ncbi:MAG: hypothetical protein J6C09_08460 [Clostridia bacterium]|nr:hypothetical protein [Clostridia bacterium]